jgi:hypothetical protein
VTVTLASETPGVAYISSPSDGSLVFGPVETRKGFYVGTNPVSTQTSVGLTATANGSTARSGVTVKP